MYYGFVNWSTILVKRIGYYEINTAFTEANFSEYSEYGRRKGAELLTDPSRF